MKRQASEVVQEVLADTVTAFISATLLFLPSLIEAILLVLCPDSSWIIVSCCSCVLVEASALGAIGLGRFISDLNSTDDKEEQVTKINNFWCPSFSSFSVIVSGSYIIYSCILWELVNIFGTIGPNINWYVRLWAFTPCIVYGPFFAAGYVFSEKMRELENKKD